MEANSDYCIGSLTDSLADYVIIYVFNMAALCAELVLVGIVDVSLLAFLVLLDLVSELSIISLLIVHNRRCSISSSTTFSSGNDYPALPILQMAELSTI